MLDETVVTGIARNGGGALLLWRTPDQARREGERGSFPGLRDVWGAHRSKILKSVFQMASF